MLRAFGESAEHFAGRIATMHGKRKNAIDRCQRCDVTRKMHKDAIGSCTAFIEAGDCTCLFAESLQAHLQPACPFREVAA